jgi:hypothetical protein
MLLIAHKDFLREKVLFNEVPFIPDKVLINIIIINIILIIILIL